MNRLAILAALATVALTAATWAPGAQAQSFPSVSSFDAPGPYVVDNRNEGPGCTIFAPERLGGDGGLKHPIILWGNGTRSMVASYSPMLRHWASQGFVVAAAITNSAGSGAPLLGCLDYLTQKAGEAGSPYAGRLDLTKVGASGHSQGGGGALMAARDPRITTTAPIQPYTLGLGFKPDAIPGQHGPILLLSGGSDTTAGAETNQMPVFDGASVPVFWATLKGSSHSAPATGDSGPYRVITTAWFRWKLMGDPAAARGFEGVDCEVCQAQAWLITRNQAWPRPAR